MRVLWASDIHLDLAGEGTIRAFMRSIQLEKPDIVLLGGDIGAADALEMFLKRIESEIRRPIYFVLGNHDFYRGSIASVRKAVAALEMQSSQLHWLNNAGVVSLTAGTALIGHDSWGDGRNGDFERSDVILNDFALIRELRTRTRRELLPILNRLGDEAAAHFRKVLPAALASHSHVLLLTHVPPWREAAWHEGRPSTDDYQPFFSCKVSGDALVEIMREHPESRLTVLCGHTHGQGIAKVGPNITVYTAGATYERPEIQKVFQVDRSGLLIPG